MEKKKDVPSVVKNTIPNLLNDLWEKISPFSEDISTIKMLIQIKPQGKDGEFVQQFGEMTVAPPSEDLNFYSGWKFKDEKPVIKTPGSMPSLPDKILDTPGNVRLLCNALKLRRSIRKGLLDNSLDAEFALGEYYTKKNFQDALRHSHPKDHEPLTKYMHRMIRLGYRGGVSPRLIIKFIVDGLDKDPRDKDELYEVENFEQLEDALAKIDRHRYTCKKTKRRRHSDIPDVKPQKLNGADSNGFPSIA